MISERRVCQGEKPASVWFEPMAIINSGSNKSVESEQKFGKDLKNLIQWTKSMNLKKKT